MSDIFDDDEKTVIKTETTKSISRFDAPASLVIWLPKARRGEQFLLERNVVIGRSLDCDISIDDTSMSKRHCEVVIGAKGVSLRDMRSTNKTYIDREPIAPDVHIPLENNCTIKMGSTVFMFYKKGSVEASNLPSVFRQAYIDPLTEILNKRAMNERGPEMLDKAVATKVPFSVLMFDIDHFKKVNDEHPERHFAGDYVLKEIASVIQNNLIRVDDLFARFGGEEFVITLYGASLEKAKEIGERMRATIEKHPFSFGGTDIPITISIGVTEWKGETDEFDKLLQRADQALYASKEGGRNRISEA